jgi:hypothetical protein
MAAWPTHVCGHKTPGRVVPELVQVFDIVLSMYAGVRGIKAMNLHFGKRFVQQFYGARGDPNRAHFVEGGGYGTNESRNFEGGGGGSRRGGVKNSDIWTFTVWLFD